MATTEESLVYEAVIEKDGVKVSKSPWGPGDEIGRLNWITPETNAAILGHLDGRHVFDLNVEFFMGMPSWVAAGDPNYQIWMTHTPQGSVNDNLSGVGSHVHEKYSYCGDSMHMYTHCGTHIDTLQPPGLLRHLLERLDARQGPREPHLEQGRPGEVPADRRRAECSSTSPACTGSTACPTATRSLPTTCARRRPSRASRSARRASSASAPDG